MATKWTPVMGYNNKEATEEHAKEIDQFQEADADGGTVIWDEAEAAEESE